MTLHPTDLALYAGALLVLFLTPGPVWVAMLARTVPMAAIAARWPRPLASASEPFIESSSGIT